MKPTAEQLHKILLAADSAANKLEAMSREFRRSNFTDRYGDGDDMKARAQALRAAIAPFWIPLP